VNGYLKKYDKGHGIMATIRVGNAPCSWGSLEFEGLENEPVGYGQMLDELVATDYAGTELGDWGYMPTAPDALRAELRQRAVTMLGAFVPVALSQAEAQASGQADAIEAARLLAQVADQTHEPFLVLADDNGTVQERTQNAGRVTPDMALDEAAWRVFARGAERIAAAVRDETGLATVFHHHCAGYVETPDEVARLMELTDPGLVGLVLDTGHYVYGAGGRAEAVTEALERFADRIGYVHFKDCEPAVAQRARDEGWDYFAAVRHGVFCELGNGCVDFPAVLAWLQNHDYEGWVTVEQDVLPGMGTPRDSARRNREYLRSIGL